MLTLQVKIMLLLLLNYFHRMIFLLKNIPSTKARTKNNSY